MNEHNENDKLRVLLLKPGELAEIAEIEDDLESMQRLVEGNIEEYMPFEDASDPRIGDCAIVCNEEGTEALPGHPGTVRSGRTES